MNYAYIPKALFYKQKSLDKLAMLHPLNATLIKRLLKMDGWNKNSSRDGGILGCLNNAYYICTIMRLDFDPTFHEVSYQGIARQGFIEGHNTFVECVTLSLVSLFIEHSTPEWHQKLQEVGDDLRRYAQGLIDEREESVLGFPDVKQTKVVELLGVYAYLSKGLDDSWVLPEELFQTRTIDANAILDLHRQDPTFNWDKSLWRMGEDDIRELIETLGKTQVEKAILIYSFWKDVYYARKQFDGPIKETWIILNSLAQEFCPDYMEITELHKIPSTGVEFEKRISELEEEVNKLKEENDELKKKLQELLDTNEDSDEEEGDDESEEDYEEDEDEDDYIEDEEENLEAPKIFKKMIKEGKVIEVLGNLYSDKVKGKRRWYIIYRVLLFIEWLKLTNQIEFINWVNSHFGWTGIKEFRGVQSEFTHYDPPKWNYLIVKGKNGKPDNEELGSDYYDFAVAVRDALVDVDKITGEMQDKDVFRVNPHQGVIHNSKWK